MDQCQGDMHPRTEWNNLGTLNVIDIILLFYFFLLFFNVMLE